MKNKKTIYHFVIDQSGSMSGSEGPTIEGFNSQLKTLQQLKKENPENEYLVSVTYFEDEVMEIMKFAPIEQIQILSRENYRPGGLTALLDGIGKSIESIRKNYDQEIRENLASVVMVILTDGGENASKFYTRNLVAEMIKELDVTGKWTFSFLGADLDAVQASNNLNIRKENIISFSKENYSGIMNQMSSSIRNYENMKSAGNMKSNLFDDIEDK
ncbi:MAG: VWA domain-containing protein, partial [Bacteroidetes bacterium]|nr:VWA domain-containing protein [Bacteroidota bacterium]